MIGAAFRADRGVSLFLQPLTLLAYTCNRCIFFEEEPPCPPHLAPSI